MTTSRIGANLLSLVYQEVTAAARLYAVRLLDSFARIAEDDLRLTPSSSTRTFPAAHPGRLSEHAPSSWRR